LNSWSNFVIFNNFKIAWHACACSEPNAVEKVAKIYQKRPKQLIVQKIQKEVKMSNLARIKVFARTRIVQKSMLHFKIINKFSQNVCDCEKAEKKPKRRNFFSRLSKKKKKPKSSFLASKGQSGKNRPTLLYANKTCSNFGSHEFY
jgi:hypothetical protein